RETRIDGSGDEVWRENGRVPTGQNRDREIEADNGMHREHQRRGDAGEQQAGRLVQPPVVRRSPPSESEDAVKTLLEPARRAVPQITEIWNHPDVPEQD